MEEKWLLLKEYDSDSTLHLKGDKLYISNTGKVKLNDDILEYGKGLYIDSGYEIHVVGYKWKYKTMYRTIYTMFIGKPHDGLYYNIHHKDFNHYNNSVDNLIELTVDEHASLHEKLDINWGYLHHKRKEIIDLYNRKNEFISNTKHIWMQRVKDYKEQKRIEKQKEKEELIKQKQIQKEIEKQNKLATGEYYISKNGNLLSLKGLTNAHNSRRGSTNSIESNIKRSISVKYRFDTDPDYRNKTCQTKGKHRYFNEETQKYFYK